MTLLVGYLSLRSSRAYRIKEFWSNMLCEIALDIIHVHLCNTSHIIFIDNGGGVKDVQTT